LEYFQLATEAHKQKDATIETALAEKQKLAEEKQELAAQLEAAHQTQMRLEAVAQSSRPLPPAPPSLAVMRQHEAMSVEPPEDFHSRTLNWARSAAGSSSVKTA
jgi:hypothetical protein